SLIGRQFAGQMLKPFQSETDVDPVEAHVYPVDQKLDDARLLRWEQLFPQRIEPLQRIAHLGFGQLWLLRSSGTPCADNDLRLAKQSTQLVDHRRLDLPCRHPS